MQPISSYMFPEMYRDLGIDVGNLGCIMLDCEPLQVSDIIAEEDLYYSENQTYTQGIVSEELPHCTLLYGLMSSGPAMKKHIDTVLDGWSLDEVQIGSIGYFESQDESEPYYCLIAELVKTPTLVEGNARLQLLPHISTFPLEYKPHLTIAYVKKDEQKRDEYIEKLSERFALETVNITGINYGDE